MVEKDSTHASDLSVKQNSNALSKINLDLIISGSIGATESVRFIRSLRRLGANVTPWLTNGAKKFVTPLAIEWAADTVVMDQFSGSTSHIGTGHALVVAPASANFIYKLANGITDTPTSALAASYLGQKKKVIVVPNMHESLFHSPGVKENLDKVAKWGVIFAAREEEGKKKFPDPSTLADHVAHEVNLQTQKMVLVTMGSTRGYIDDVRYVSNYSSGALGSLVTEELYRRGFEVVAVAGPSPILPKTFSKLIQVETNDEMLKEASKVMDAGASAAILAASVLDYVPDKKAEGKIRSTFDSISVDLKQTAKIIAQINPTKKPSAKIGFKLETDLTKINLQALVADYMGKYQLSLMVVNQLSDVSQTKHRALIFSSNDSSYESNGKEQLSQIICQHVVDKLELGAQRKA